MKDFLKNHFVPHKGNDYHPHLLQKMAMGMMMFLVLLSFITANIQALIWVNIDWMVSAVLPAVVVAKTNTERESDALGALTRNNTLDRAAQMKAEHMAKNSYFAHFSPDGISPWHWFAQAGYSFLHAGENLAVHFNDSGEVVEAWMDSPTHRANIMNGTYTEIGIGVAKGTYEGYDTVFVVQLFGTPTKTQVPAVVAAVIEEESAERDEIKQSDTFEEPEVAGIEESVSLIVPVVPEVVEPEKPVVVDTPDVDPRVPVAVDFVQLVEQGQALAVEQTEAKADEDAVVQALQPASTSEQRASESLTTSTIAVASTESVDPLSPQPWHSFITQPLLLLQGLYIGLGSVVALTLLISLVLEWRRHHPLQTVYSGGLIATMALLWYAQTLLIGGAAII